MLFDSTIAQQIATLLTLNVGSYAPESLALQEWLYTDETVHLGGTRSQLGCPQTPTGSPIDTRETFEKTYL